METKKDLEILSFSITIPAEYIKTLERIAAKQSISVGNLVHDIIVNYIKGKHNENLKK